MHDQLIASATRAFEQSFDGSPTHRVLAPGRVNLIGEHTDYNDGFVLPCAIDRGTVVVARARTDQSVRVVAADYNCAVDEFRLDAPITPRADAQWPNYVRGTIRELLAHGYALSGMELTIAGNVPQGAGLSSSASLEVGIVQACKTLHRLDSLEPTDMALIAQRAENEFVGCNCGIMDQMISARGEAGCALLIDCRSLETRAVPLPAGLAVMIVDSRVQRGLVDSEYNQRRTQCEQAARHFGLRALRDATPALLAERGTGLDPQTLRRARHVVTENARTLAACDALAAGDMQRMSELMAQSHASMRDDFEITVPPIDQLVSILHDVIGTRGGVRMTGGGFGGCVVALLPHDLVTAAGAAIEAQYRAPRGEPAGVYICEASASAGTLA